MTAKAELGTPEFEKTMFMLDVAPTAANIKDFALQGNLYPEPLDDTAWALPGYLSDDFNMFLVFAPNVLHHWTVTCSKVTIENGKDITEMSNVVPTGSGMNAVAHVSKAGAIELLAYFKTLEANGLGHFDDEVWQYV
ncbi:hypothetical protein FC99_GL000582 [Levilactobacillus koreensis JCM 16448]|uniref:Uncharacterized protein n=1 Tax=Levilactobacillus koreensis TaxID=637971 RepID=A0AAC8UUD3_9LACO|nr:hypothetical protein [Levilactobacillus koreensis]AKP64353.1 hypothetical protein ABN16_04655 [Levilactobacillus koreensis]KRK88488.1 hypothetical protein FC99_GL000582 [Levilactobacillus koreensis JCM 16448]